MKITNKKAIDIINALTTKEIGEKRIPRKLSFAITKNVEQLSRGIYTPYSKEYESLNKKYQVLDEHGNQEVDKYNRLIYTDKDSYEKELKELLEIENNFEPHFIDEELLDQCENEDKYSNLSHRELYALMMFLKE